MEGGGGRVQIVRAFFWQHYRAPKQKRGASTSACDKVMGELLDS